MKGTASLLPSLNLDPVIATEFVHDMLRQLPAQPGTCRVCQCTDADACPGGCSWVDADHTLCSECCPPPATKGSSKYAQYVRLNARSSTLGDLFFQQHENAIFASRPSAAKNRRPQKKKR